MALTITPIARTNPAPLSTNSQQTTLRFAKAPIAAPVATRAADYFTTRNVAAAALDRATAQKPEGMSDEQWFEVRKNNEAFLQSYGATTPATDKTVSVDLSKDDPNLLALQIRQQASAQTLIQANRQPGWIVDLLR